MSAHHVEANAQDFLRVETILREHGFNGDPKDTLEWLARQLASANALQARVAQLEAFVPVRGRTFEALKEMFRSLQAFETALLEDCRREETRAERMAKEILNSCDKKYAMYGSGRRLAQMVLGLPVEAREM